MHFRLRRTGPHRLLTMKQSLKTRLAQGKSISGVMLAANSTALVELAGTVGFDYVLIDLQHTPASWETAQDLVRAAQFAGISALVRVARNDTSDILKALDIGAEGIVLPFVRTAGEVRAAYAASHYLPLGERSICSQTRVARYGAFDGSYVDWLRKLNEDVFLMGVVEDMQGIAALPAMLSLEHGLDAIAIGRGDLAASLGVAGQQADPGLLKVVDDALETIARCKNERTHLAVFTYSEQEIAQWAARGTRVFCHMSEVSLFVKGARQYLEVMKNER